LEIFMQEIAPHVFIETAYAGVTLGAISLPLGLILLDAPFRQEDTRSWRAGLLNLGGGVDRLLINLDAHFDRTLGTRAMECTVVGHEKLAQAFRNRPVTFKAQAVESGAEWEQYNGLGSIRWAPPEITFTERMQIHWGDEPLVLESHAGPATGSIWALLPASQVGFVGDAVLANQPPFLANADLPAWISSLDELLAPSFQNTLLISGRGGLVTRAEVAAQQQFLKNVQSALEGLAGQNAPVEEAVALTGGLLREIEAAGPRQHQYQQRLQWGLRQYYLRHYRQETPEEIEE
jgi:glyoxylase-like metal-dependent hydrolase (beta-lactamase superfamily II)